MIGQSIEHPRQTRKTTRAWLRCSLRGPRPGGLLMSATGQTAAHKGL